MRRLLVMLSALMLLVPFAPALADTCVQTSINYSAPSSTGTGQVCAGNKGLIINFLIDIVRFLGGLVGLVVVLMIIIGAIQYVAAGGSPQALAAAKSRISNALIALVLYILMFGILQYLLPGGVVTL